MIWAIRIFCALMLIAAAGWPGVAIAEERTAYDADVVSQIISELRTKAIPLAIGVGGGYSTILSDTQGRLSIDSGEGTGPVEVSYQVSGGQLYYWTDEIKGEVQFDLTAYVMNPQAFPDIFERLSELIACLTFMLACATAAAEDCGGADKVNMDKFKVDCVTGECSYECL